MAAKQNLTARDAMTAGTQCVGERQTLLDACKVMRDLEVGAVPICGDDNKLKGMITDRDIVVDCCAEGRDPADVRAGEMAGELHWVDADADISECLDLMENYQIKRLPVIDVKDNHRLVGMISETDLAKNLTDEQLAEFVSMVYATT